MSFEKNLFREEVLAEIKKKGFWKEGKMTYVIEEREYPHDEQCEGSMCWCAQRAKRENRVKNETDKGRK